MRQEKRMLSMKMRALSMILLLIMTFSVTVAVHAQDISTAVGISEDRPDEEIIVSKDVETGEISSRAISDFSDYNRMTLEDQSVPYVPPTEPLPDMLGNQLSDPMDDLWNTRGYLGKSIIGTDNRKQANPYVYGIAHITTYWKNGETLDGTAFVFANKALATAGHCVYNKAKGGWAKYITVVPSRKGSSKPFGTFTSTTLHTSNSWISSSNANYDYAVIEVGSNVGAKTGLFGLSSSSATGNTVTINGYPGEKPQQQWLMSGSIQSVSTNRLFYSIDTTGGQSGSPIYKSNYTAVGIHTDGVGSGSGASTTKNSGVRITGSLLNWLVTFRK